MNSELTAETTLAGLNDALLATWAATNSPTCTGREMQRLYKSAADLRRQIAALEAERAQQTAEIVSILTWLES